MRPSTRPANYCATLLPILHGSVASRLRLSPTASFYPKIALRSRRDRLTIDQCTRGSGRKQQVVELNLTTSEILVFYHET
ncbi:hypothetical protein ALC53_08917 [Atta colombica]|uniref:Uncharacterized protein n=1 Tax=Atta colombica TaxID=520822 RepID=A0A195B890_9HYME|nr:hypothetical protein ALC53_08917 [Atta colombica]